MAYGDFKDLNRRTAANKILRDKAFDNAKKIIKNGRFNLPLLIYIIMNTIKNYTTIH